MIADDHFLVREGVRMLLEDSGEVEVLDAVGTATELRRARRRAGARRGHDRHPDAARATRWRASTPPTGSAPSIRGIGVVVLSQHADESYAFELLKNGTAGLAYLLKDRVGDIDEMLGALRAVCDGRSAIDARVVDALVQRRTRRERSGLEELTPRELDVMREMAQGKSNAGIAAALVLSESAVEKHVSAIFSKLGRPGEEGIHRRVAAVLAFLQG